jgi:hypothetical protein
MQLLIMVTIFTLVPGEHKSKTNPYLQTSETMGTTTSFPDRNTRLPQRSKASNRLQKKRVHYKRRTLFAVDSSSISSPILEHKGAQSPNPSVLSIPILRPLSVRSIQNGARQQLRVINSSRPCTAGSMELCAPPSQRGESGGHV